MVGSGATPSIRRSAGLVQPSPRLDDVCHVFTVGCCQTDADAKEREFRMRIMTAMEFRDWLRINVSSLSLDQNALLEVSLKDPLQHNKESRAVMTVPVGVATWSDLRVVDLNFDFRIPRNGCKQLVKENIAIELLARVGITAQAK